MDAMTANQSSTRISILIPCKIDDTDKLVSALECVANKLRVSATSIRGCATSQCAWSLSDAEALIKQGSQAA